MSLKKLTGMAEECGSVQDCHFRTSVILFTMKKLLEKRDGLTHIRIVSLASMAVLI